MSWYEREMFYMGMFTAFVLAGFGFLIYVCLYAAYESIVDDIAARCAKKRGRK